MNLGKAIETIQEILDDEDSRWESDAVEAFKLIIEAGKREASLRLRYPLVNDALLPGETKD